MRRIALLLVPLCAACPNDSTDFDRLDAFVEPSEPQTLAVEQELIVDYRAELLPVEDREHSFRWTLTVTDPDLALDVYREGDWTKLEADLIDVNESSVRFIGANNQVVSRAFRCQGAGTATVTALAEEGGVGVEQTDDGYCVPVDPWNDEDALCEPIAATVQHTIVCTSDGDPPDPGRQVREAAVQIANTASLSSSPSAWGLGSSVSGAYNMIMRSPAERRSVAEYFSPVPDLEACETFEGVPVDGWTSEQGVDAVQVDTRTQSAAVTWDTDRYVWSGLVDAPAWEVISFVDDTVNLRWDASGTPMEVQIPPPGVANGFWSPNSVLSTPAGYDTTFAAVSARANVITIFAVTADSAGTQNGFTCLFDAPEDLTGVPLVPAELRVFAADHGGIGDLWVGEFTEQMVDGLFPDHGAVPVHVGALAHIEGVQINP